MNEPHNQQTTLYQKNDHQSKNDYQTNRFDQHHRQEIIQSRHSNPNFQSNPNKKPYHRDPFGTYQGQGHSYYGYNHHNLKAQSNSSSLLTLVLGRSASNASGRSNSIIATHYSSKNVPKLEAFKITTLSNTRVDKVDIQKELQSQEVEDNHVINSTEANNDHEFHEPLQKDENALALSTPPFKMLPLPNKEDSYFCYDYETYMFHVTTVGKPCIGFPQVPSQSKFSEQGAWAYDTDSGSGCGCGPNSIIHCNFGLELLDLSGIIIIKRCLFIPPAIQGAFHSDGSYPCGVPYEVTTITGSPMFFMTETTNCIDRLLSCGWVGLKRSYTATIVDVCGRHAMDVTNNLGLGGICCCCCCCCQCCCFTSGDCCCIASDSKEFVVSLADGEVLGYVGQTRGDRCNPGFAIKDAYKNNMIHGSGPKCSICDRLSFFLSVFCCCFSCLIEDDVFYFSERRGKRIAEVRRTEVVMPFTRNSEPFGSDICTDYEVVVSYADGLSVRIKALLLAVSFVIDFLYWQSSGE